MRHKVAPDRTGIRLLHPPIIFPVIFFVLISLSCTRSEQPHSSDHASERKVRVIATLFPLYDFARSIGGIYADVTLLLPPGTEPHSFEPKPGDAAALSRADIFLFTGKHMEPWAVRFTGSFAGKKTLVIDASKGITLRQKSGGDRHEHHEHHAGEGRFDPHIWLDFGNAERMADTIAAAFTEKDSEHRDYYARNAEGLKSRMRELDRSYRESLADCGTRTLLHGGHAAFGYLASRYNLRYISAYGGSPNAEPSPEDIAKIVRLMKKSGVRTVFFEELVTPRVAETISRETGARMLMLHGAHNISKQEFESGTTFPALMERNLENLKTGLQCGKPRS